MSVGLIGKKCGMTRVFNEDGASVPVTVIEALPNRISQIKKIDKEGYSAIQVSSGGIKQSKINKVKSRKSKFWISIKILKINSWFVRGVAASD